MNPVSAALPIHIYPEWGRCQFNFLKERNIMSQPITNELPNCLRQLTRQEKEQIQDTLANNDVSSDDDIVDFWIVDCNISKDAAEAAIKFRQMMLVVPMLDLFELFC